MAPVDCNEEGACKFDKFSTLSSAADGGDLWDRESGLGLGGGSSLHSGDESRKSSAESTQNLVPVIQLTQEQEETAAASKKVSNAASSAVSNFKRKMASVRRKTSDQTVRKFRYVFNFI